MLDLRGFRPLFGFRVSGFLFCQENGKGLTFLQVAPDGPVTPRFAWSFQFTKLGGRVFLSFALIVELRRRIADPYLDIGSRLKIDALVSNCQVIGKMLSVGLHASVIEFSGVMLELRQSLHLGFGFLQAGLK